MATEKKICVTEEMAREKKIWLPEEVVLTILGNLPTRILVRMRSMCKRWNVLLSSPETLVNLHLNIPLSSTPAFFLHLVCGEKRCNGEEKRDVYHEEPKSWVIEESTRFYQVEEKGWVNAACNNIYCCNEEGENGDRFSFRICNPRSRTWNQVPCPPSNEGDFNATVFDTSTRRCTLLLGQFTPGIGGTQIEIYDSEIDAWTTNPFHLRDDVWPCGRGVYSRGKFYWRNMFSYSGEVLELSSDMSSWTKIPGPQSMLDCFPGSWHLTGCDGRSMLVNTELGCIWKLIIEDGVDKKYQWCQQQQFRLPKSSIEVAVNSRGWILVVLKEKLVIYDEGGEIVRKIEFCELDPRLLAME
ncbi:hypothetical protein KI387_008033, partial [Taxus chinensis]